MNLVRYRTVVGVAALFSLITVVGCNEPMWNSDQKKLVPQQQLTKSDIPVPEGFDLDEPASEDRSGGGTRLIRYVFYGKADGQMVRTFYREQMPVEKWNQTGDEMRSGQYVMQFEKGSEVCEVTISGAGRGLMTKTKLRIEVLPGKGRARSPKSTSEDKMSP